MLGKSKPHHFKGKIALQPLNFTPKVIFAWTEAVAGNKTYLDILLKSEFKYLGLFVYALHLKEDAREWLLHNGYAHLMAMINGVEGNKSAINWLMNNGFDTLMHIALSADGHKESFEWLINAGHKDFALLSKKIELLKDEIEADNNDPHRINGH